LVCGELSLTTVAMLRPHLTAENHEALLREARGRSKREVEALVRRIAPLQDVRASIRKVGGAAAVAGGGAGVQFVPLGATELACWAQRTPPPETAADSRSASLAGVPRRAEVRALSPVSYSLRVTMSAAAHDKLRKAQHLLRHQVPNGDPAIIVERALTLLVEQLERTKFAKRAGKPKRTTSGKPKANVRERERTPSANENARQAKPAEPRSRKDDGGREGVPGGCRRPRSRRVPASVRRVVWERDQGRCAFLGTAGRCTETGMLEFHHRVPFAERGEATAGNIELRCRNHNQHEAETWERGVRPLTAGRSGPSCRL
jgi:hypothetical protein